MNTIHTHTHTQSVLRPFFQDHPGWPVPPLIHILHSSRFPASSCLSPNLFMSPLTTSIHIFLGLPLGFDPSIFSTVQPFTQYVQTISACLLSPLLLLPPH